MHKLSQQVLVRNLAKIEKCYKSRKSSWKFLYILQFDDFFDTFIIIILTFIAKL